jgi:hypothetical protein
LLERALQVDPQNARAKATLARFERGEPKRSEKARLIAAGSILGAAILAIAFILLRRTKPTPEAATPSPPAPDPDAAEPSPEAPKSADEKIDAPD